MVVTVHGEYPGVGSVSSDCDMLVMKRAANLENL
jgi:hypothetical protein